MGVFEKYSTITKSDCRNWARFITNGTLVFKEKKLPLITQSYKYIR